MNHAAPTRAEPIRCLSWQQYTDWLAGRFDPFAAQGKSAKSAIDTKQGRGVALNQGTGNGRRTAA